MAGNRMALLHAEHAAFGPSIDGLRRLAAAAPSALSETLADDLDRALRLLDDYILPLAAAEDEVLLPALSAAGSNDAVVARLRHEHAALRRLVRWLRTARTELEYGVDDDLRDRLARLLDTIYKLTVKHLSAEEDEVAKLEGELSGPAVRSLADDVERAEEWQRARA